MRKLLRYFLPFPLLALAACRAQGVRDIPRCPPCPCLRDMSEAPRRDLSVPHDLSVLPDLSCAPLGRTCVDLPCCPGLTCIGGACAAFPVR